MRPSRATRPTFALAASRPHHHHCRSAGRHQAQRELRLLRRAPLRRELQHPRYLALLHLPGRASRPSQHNGFMAYTTETRATLTKLLPTCTQPTAQQLAAQQAFEKRQQAALAARDSEVQPHARTRRICSRIRADLVRRDRPAQERRRAPDAPLRLLWPSALLLHRQRSARRILRHDLLHALRPHRRT